MEARSSHSSRQLHVARPAETRLRPLRPSASLARPPRGLGVDAYLEAALGGGTPCQTESSDSSAFEVGEGLLDTVGPALKQLIEYVEAAALLCAVRGCTIRPDDQAGDGRGLSRFSEADV